MHIVVVGGGMAGLGTALACARDGHRVTILERDATPMPESADAAFSWERRGAPQVRHSHAFLARSPQPAARSRARRARRAVRGGRDRDPVHCDAAADPDRQGSHGRATKSSSGSRAGARRSNGCCAASVLAEPGVELRDGVAVDGLDAVAGIAAARDGRGRDRRPTSWSTRAARARPRIRGSRQSARRPCPKSCTRAGSSTSRASTECSPTPTRRRLPNTAAVDLGYLKYAVFVGDNETFSITYAVDTHDDELRKALARRGTVRSRRAGARADRTLAGARRRGADHGCARDGRVAQPATGPSSSTARRSCTGSCPSVMRLCARTRSTAGGARWPWCTASRSADVLREHGDDLDAVAREFSAFTDRELVPWFRASVVQDENARHGRRRRGVPARRSACLHAERSSATGCCPRCGRRRSCSARSCVGSTS